MHTYVHVDQFLWVITKMHRHYLDLCGHLDTANLLDLKCVKCPFKCLTNFELLDVTYIILVVDLNHEHIHIGQTNRCVHEYTNNVTVRYIFTCKKNIFLITKMWYILGY